MPSTNRLLAEGIGTFWVVFAGCGSAVLGADFPQFGNRDKGQSPYGVHDLAGNLYEWVTDWYDEEFYTTNPPRNPRGPDEGTAKVQRGGSYINNPYRIRAAFRTKGDPTEHDPHVGFRCAQDAPALP